MKKKILTYIIVFAIITNLISPLFFADSEIHRYTDPQNVSASFGFCFYGASLLAWCIAALIYGVSKFKK